LTKSSADRSGNKGARPSGCRDGRGR